MKTTLSAFVLVAGASLSATAAHATLPGAALCKQEIAALQQQFDVAKDRYTVGEVTVADVKQTELALVEGRLECADITRTDFCAIALPDAQQGYDAISAEANVGQRTEKDVIDAQKALFEVKADCE